MSTFNQFLKLTEKHVAPESYDIQKDWEKEGSRFRHIPYDEYKSRQVGKPDFKDGKMSDIEVEQWFTNIASKCDGRLQAKILKGFDKHGDKYKQSGDNMETYKSWIIDAMVRCGFMIEGVIQEHLLEKDDVATHLDNLEDVVGKAKDFFTIGKELDRGGYKKKYFYSDTMAPTYTIEVDGFKFAIINKKYVDKGDREVGDIAIGLLESMQINEVKEYKAGDTVKLKTGETVKINQVVKGPRPQFNTYRAKIKGKQVDFGSTDINEGKKVTLKRRYTENHPAITAGQHAKIRNKILEAIGDGQITQEEFDAILKELSNDKGRWARRNAKYFNVSEEGISLSKFGKRIFKSITVNENKENKPMENKFLFETFGQFVDANFLNEAFKSMRFAELFMSTSRYSGKKSMKKDLVKAFYNSTKVNLAKIEDEDLLTSDPQTVYKNKTDDTIVFYISDNEKENPYAPYDAYSSNKTIPGGGYLLAMATGKNEFYGVEWSRYSGGRTLSKRDPSDSVGISKKYKGWDATGLYNVKRIAEVADRAVVLNIALLKQKYSTAEIRASREEARKGATAFKNDKDFRDANRARYHKILADKAASLPLDKMVEEAIDKLAKQISDGLKKGEKTQYDEIKIGVSPKGREVKARDASAHMSNILDDYGRYVSYIKQAEESEERYGERESYYERESKDYAKRIKEKVAKVDTFDYAW